MLLLLFISLSCLFVYANSAQAGTTVINVHTEGSGEVNLNGAMVWNGTQWVVNNTWAHKYFVDVRTGQRLKDYTSTDFSGSIPEVANFMGYQVTQPLHL